MSQEEDRAGPEHFVVRILGATKKSALSQGTIGCVGEVSTLNISRGCAASCAFCYARCYTGAPDPGTVLVYTALPGQLRGELDSKRRKRPMPRYVVVGTASDPFIGGQTVLQVTRACLEILLRRDVGVSLMTRGNIPDDIIDLLAKHAPLVQLTIPLATLDEDYTRGWETDTATAAKRLFLIQRLKQAGIDPWIRIEPIIPFVNDGSDEFRSLISALAGLDIKRASASFLQLRPGVADQLGREAPTAARRLVLGAFSSSEQRRRGFEHLPARQTSGALRRLQKIAWEYGTRVVACGCQNPGLPAGQCPVVPRGLPQLPRGQQPELFEQPEDDS